MNQSWTCAYSGLDALKPHAADGQEAAVRAMVEHRTHEVAHQVFAVAHQPQVVLDGRAGVAAIPVATAGIYAKRDVVAVERLSRAIRNGLRSSGGAAWSSTPSGPRG